MSGAATELNPALLEHSWTAEVVLKNGQELTIWHTAWHSSKHIIKEIKWIASDLPKRKLEERCSSCNLLINQTKNATT